MRRYAVLAGMIALVLSWASVCDAQSPPTRVTPPEPMDVRKADDAAQSFRGVWNSDKDPAGSVAIMPLRLGAISIIASGRFEAIGFVDGSSSIALVSIPGAPSPQNQSVHYGVLRITKRDDKTLLVRYADDMNSAPTAEETWTFRMLRPERPARATPDTRSGNGLPAYGEYVYVTELPEAIVKSTPAYPADARAAGVEGSVLVQVLVGTDGLVKDTRIVKSIPKLDDAAVASVKQWRFKAAMSNGAPAAVWVAVPVKFSLH